MNRNRIALLLLLATSTAGCTVYTEPPPPPPAGDAEVVAGATVAAGGVSVEVFYNELRPYGRWVVTESYGRVFVPAGVEVGWRPYREGHWVHSDYGWTWISEERFGWATYHYGRWYADPVYGWAWVPGTDWGPAWVSFQRGGGYIGWAPLPPAVGFRAGIGLQLGGIDLAVAIEPRSYAFVEDRVFLAPRIATYVVAPTQNVTIIHNTTNITNISVVNNKIVNQSVSVQNVEQATGQKVQHFQIADAKAAGAHGQVQGNQIAIYRPVAVKSASATANGQVKRTLPAGGQAAGRRQGGEVQAMPGGGVRATSGASSNPASGDGGGGGRTTSGATSNETSGSGGVRSTG
ncbi:MAG: hypothetical protein M3O15_14670, partial [Acidobacteriota bacterium]|nr:hypothetical protein [Acidobacteriota bacterium]